MSKIKILWIVYDFVQAGGQRVVFDICKALDKDKYQIDILKLSPMNYDTTFSSEFYYEPSLKLNIRVFLLQDLYNHNKIKKTILKQITNKIKRKIGINVSKPLTKKEILTTFLEQYKFLHFSGISVYEDLFIRNGLYFENAIIHLMTARFQDSKLYDGFNKTDKYSFMGGFNIATASFELEKFSLYDYIYFPLSIEAKTFEVPINKTEQLKIGIFTRLYYMKPLDPYLYALKLLVEQGLNVKLYLYGSGNPDKIGLTRQLEYLYLTSFVEICGHTDSIKDTLINNPLDLVWFQAANSQVAGLAAFEVALGAVPQVLWDFNFLNAESEVSNYFKSFTNLIKFVDYSKDLLLHKNKLKELGLLQQSYIFEEHSIEKNISILEQKYDS